MGETRSEEVSIVEKIMAMADEYANAISVKCGIKFILEQRQALEEELKNLFSPLDERDIGDACSKQAKHGVHSLGEAFKMGAKYAENQHGIGVKND